MLHETCIVLLLATASSVRGSTAPIATVSGGQVSGVTERSSEGHEFYAYYSIPYAKPPLGRLRFKDPEPADPWEGVLPGSSQPEPCIQVPLLETMLSEGPPNTTSGSEDCLYLNVFTPAEKDPEDELPVMVWIHGGGYFSGGAAEYLPDVLLNHDIVLVVLQYRLGILGFLSTEDDVIPGNYGLKDQTMALQWVQENIHNFGGDASRVTIFGESAGGASVHFHILSPKSKGLFKRAIVQSGTQLSSWAKNTGHREVAERTSDAMGCQDLSNSDAILECLQAVDANDIVLYSLSFYKWLFLPMTMVPRVDGDFLPDDPEDLVRKGHFAHVDLLSGVTADEGVFFTNLMMGSAFSEQMINSFNANFSRHGPLSIGLRPEDPEVVSITSQIYEYYLGHTTIDRDDHDELLKLFTDMFFVIDHDLTCLFHARYATTFRYSLDYHGDLSLGDFFKGQGSKAVSHCDDLYYLFRGGEFLQPSQQPEERPHDLVSEDDLALRKIITTTWTNFAATGNPTPDDSLGFTWKPATSEDLVYLSLKPEPTMEEDKRQEVREFHATLNTRRNQLLFLKEKEEEKEEQEEEEKEDEKEAEEEKEEEEGESEDEDEEEGEKEEEDEKEDSDEEDEEKEEEEEEGEDELPDAEVAFERQFNQDEL